MVLRAFSSSNGGQRQEDFSWIPGQPEPHRKFQDSQEYKVRLLLKNKYITRTRLVKSYKD